MRTLALATAFAAASGYLVLLLAARDLGAARYEIFAVYWGLFFALAGIVNGIMQETTRAVSVAGAAEPRAGADAGRRADAERRADAGRGAAAGRVAVPARLGPLLGGALALVVIALGPLWAPEVLTDSRLTGIALLGAGVVSFSVFATLAGTLSGTGRWRAYAALLTVDAALRLIAAGVTVVAGFGPTGFLVTTVAGSIAWIPLLVTRSARASLRAPTALGARAFIRGVLTAAAAAAATQVLIVGFPVLLKATADGVAPATLGALIMAVTLTRAPLLVPLTSFQTAIIVHFVRLRDSGARALVTPLAGIIGVGAVAAVLARAVGPWFLRAVFGPDFALSGAALAALTCGAAATAALVVAGSAALAHGLHTAYAASWWVATLVSVGVLLLADVVFEGDFVSATSTALIAGPVVGVLSAVVAVSWAPAPETVASH